MPQECRFSVLLEILTHFVIMRVTIISSLKVFQKLNFHTGKRNHTGWSCAGTHNGTSSGISLQLPAVLPF